MIFDGYDEASSAAEAWRVLVDIAAAEIAIKKKSKDLAIKRIIRPYCESSVKVILEVNFNSVRMEARTVSLTNYK